MELPTNIELSPIEHVELDRHQVRELILRIFGGANVEPHVATGILFELLAMILTSTARGDTDDERLASIKSVMEGGTDYIVRNYGGFRKTHDEALRDLATRESVVARKNNQIN